MRPAILFRIAALTVASTGFYTLVGQLVPQKEVHPPKEVALKKDMSQADMMKTGREIMEGKGLCLTCHTIGKAGGPFRFPDLGGIGARASTRIPGLSDVQYLAQSIYDPGAFIVPGYNPGMPVINKPPIGLSDQEILCVIAYLQSMGGKPTVTMDSKVWPLDAAGTAAPAPAASAGPVGADASPAPAAVAPLAKAPGVK
jgi:mono/diheme cytochrome c family protein